MAEPVWKRSPQPGATPQKTAHPAVEPKDAFFKNAADFLAAHDAFRAGDRAKLGRYAARLKSTPLEVYVSYYQLSLGLETASLKVIKDFLARPENTPLLDQLRGEWLKQLGKRQQWDMFDDEYPHLLNADVELTCYALQSRRRNEDLAALQEARKLWFTGKSQPDSCGVLFDAALSAGIITRQDVSQRLRLALEKNNVSLATKLAEQPDGKNTGLAVMLKSAASDPDRYLKKLTPENAVTANNSDATVDQAPNSLAVETKDPGSNTSLPSEEKQEGLLSPQKAIIPSPSAGLFGWRSIVSMLGFNKGGKLPSATTNSSTASPATPANATPQANNTSSDAANMQLTPLPNVGASPGTGAGCIACVALSEANAPPPLGWYAKLTSEGQRAAALFALQRLAKQSPELAVARWGKIAGYFPVSEQHYFYGLLAYEAARNLDARSLRWYKAATDIPLNEQQAAWRVRAALRAHDWPEVLASVNLMNESQQHEAAWRYWKARALQALGKPIDAREIYAPLSGEFNFYGQLASAELADTPVLSESTPVYKPDNATIDEMLAQPGIQRTLALYRMGLRSEALEEWRWELRNFNDRELLTAAEIARRNEMYDRAIGAADKTVSVHDFSLRYLAPYRSELQAHIREHGLEEAWVYGLMRQESRFATAAKSETGASGLMQVMPSTARWVANKLGFKSYHSALIHQIDTNLRIGTYYMKSVLSQSENNPVLATAAYNAGPVRALQWRGDQPLEGAIYVETIPFEETRDYVKKVMSNTVYYADQFGDSPRSLKQRMGIIAAKDIGNKTTNNRTSP